MSEASYLKCQPGKFIVRSSAAAMPRGRFIVKCGILLNLIISSIIILSSLNSEAQFTEARRSSSGSSSVSLLTKKPPFNGSIFGKRSSGPPIGAPPTPAPPLAYDYSLLYPTAYEPTAALNGGDGSNSMDASNYLMALYQQQQQQQQLQHEFSMARVALNKCIVQREVSTGVGTNAQPNGCDELLALVNYRSRYN